MGNRSAFFRLLQYMGRWKRTYAILIVTMIISIILELSVAWFLSLITNAAVNLEVERWPKLIIFGAGMLLFMSLNTYVDTYYKQKASFQVRNDLRLDTMDHVLRLPQSYNDKIHTGDLLARFTSDNQAVGEASGNIIMGLLKNPLLAICAFIYLLNIHWPLALITISIGPLLILVGRIFGETMRRKGIRLQESTGISISFVQDVLNASVIYKIFGLERKLASRYKQYSTEITSIERSQGQTQGAASAVSQGIGNITFILAILLAGFFVAKGSLQVGDMMAFIQLMNYLVNPFSAIPSLWSNMQQALAGAERIYSIIDASKEYEKLPDESKAHVSFKELSVDNIDFRYGDTTSAAALQDVNFKVYPGQTVAIVGSSGGGKSTLFKVLLGLYPPTAGEIKIDGMTTGTLGLRSYRDYFSLVPQEPQLFTGTIRDNIKDGNQSLTEDQVVEATKKANAYDFVKNLPMGLDSDVGERGSLLSGGQKQRIAIARAIARDAPILLLDEATAALDNESERIVQDTLSNMMQHKTTLVIAHRLSTVQSADLILVIENGEIVERGKHEELLKAEGRYHELYYSQLEKERSALST